MRAQWTSNISCGVKAACAALLFASVVMASHRISIPAKGAIAVPDSPELNSAKGRQGDTLPAAVRHATILLASSLQVQYPSAQGRRPDYNSTWMVQRAQTELYNRGLYDGLIDGQMNSRTHKAIADFQKQNGLPATGSLDQQTAARLDLLRRGPRGGPADRQLAASIYRKAQSLLNNYQASLGIQVNDISAGLTSNRVLNEADLDLLLQTSSFATAAAWYQQSAANASNFEGTRIAARILASSAQRVETSLQDAQQNSRFQQEWTSIQSDLTRACISDTTGYTAEPDTDDDSGQVSGPGHFQWQGIVDGSDNIRVQGSYVDTVHLTAGPIQQATYQLSAPLPNRSVQVKLRKVRGRGHIKLLEQPTASNDFTVVVQVDDQDDSGSAWYEFTLDW